MLIFYIFIQWKLQFVNLKILFLDLIKIQLMNCILLFCKIWQYILIVYLKGILKFIFCFQSYGHCCLLERTLEQINSTTASSCFPIIVGRRPNTEVGGVFQSKNHMTNNSVVSLLKFMFFIYYIWIHLN